MAEPNYFTCSLGQAAELKSNDKTFAASFETVIELIDGQADSIPNSPAVGFARFKPEEQAPEFGCQLTFAELADLSKAASHVLSTQLKVSELEPGSETVGLICTSGIEFILTALGLMRLGFSVLFLAPQLEPPAIRHLCKTLGVKELFSDTHHQRKVDGLGECVNVRLIPSYNNSGETDIKKGSEAHTGSGIAYYCHTSGTSSGLPKPIAQTHFGLVGALPRFPGANKPATFSSTPLYHGGFVDCFRAWTSGAMIWFFPEGLAPVTGDNLLSAISFAQKSSTLPIKYFSSVPYVLQMLAEEEKGIELLRTMELVGVGGAALPPSTGDKLVKAGVNVLSRMGSAECGFLMSSHRDYAQDQDWQYLRPVANPTMLSFEPREGGLSELVVKSGWPFLVKTNREDGSYATSDLFQPHPSKPNAWRYHSRADAQIALANGKKFDPSPIEESLRASTNLLQDILIFGSGKDYPGALLFPTSSDVTEQDVLQSFWPQMEKLNADTQSHARITRPMLIVVPTEDGKVPLEKSSKGTIMRRQAEERYADIIEDAYNGKSSATVASNLSDDELLPTVLDCFFQVLGRKVDPEADLYRQGVGSLSCIQVRKLIETSCVPHSGPRLPMNIIYDQGTIAELVKYLQGVRQGKTTEGMDDDTQLQLMQQLVTKYSNFKSSASPYREKRGKTVLLTGATGFLGAHIVHILRQDPSIQKVYCLLRAQSSIAAHERVSDGLQKRGMPGLESDGQLARANEKVVCMPCDLQRQDLGLSEADRQQVIDETTIIIHAAWTVNFTLRLSSFEDQILGTRNLLDLAEQASAKFVLISSTAAVISSTSEAIPEQISKAASDASPLGYSRSKWVAESVCAAAYEHRLKNHASNIHEVPVSIIRIGQLCSNDAGFWNATEAYPLMLSTANLAGCLPVLENEVLNWMPGELAAQAVLDIAIPDEGASLNKDKEFSEAAEKTPVFHVLNYHQTPTWHQMLAWIALEADEPFEIVKPSVWVTRLEAAIKEKDRSHPAQALLALWKDSYVQEDTSKDKGGVSTPPRFEVTDSCKVSKTMRELQPLSEDRVLRMWKWIQNEVGNA